MENILWEKRVSLVSHVSHVSVSQKGYYKKGKKYNLNTKCETVLSENTIAQWLVPLLGMQEVGGSNPGQGSFFRKFLFYGIRRQIVSLLFL